MQLESFPCETALLHTPKPLATKCHVVYIVCNLQVLAKAVRGVAAGTQDRDTQEYILQSSKQVMDQSVALIREAKNAVEAPNQPNKQLRLAQVQMGKVEQLYCRLD